MESIRTWQAHSNQPSFLEQFNTITSEYKHNNELRTQKLEEFLVAEAQIAGVIKAHPVKI
jgi:hypothetical protein